MRVNFWAIIAHSVLKTAGFTEEIVWVVVYQSEKNGNNPSSYKTILQKK